MNAKIIIQLFNSIEKSMEATGKYDINEIRNTFDTLKSEATELLKFGGFKVNAEWEQTNIISKAVKTLSCLQNELLKHCLDEIDVMPGGLNWLINKAVILDYLHDDIAVWKILTKLRTLFDNDLISDYRILWECGDLCYKLNRYDESIEYYKKYIYVSRHTQDLDDPNVYNLIGHACIKIGYCYEFKNEFSKALCIYTLITGNVDPYVKEIVPVSFVDEIKDLISGIEFSELSEDNSYDLKHGLGHFYNEFVLFPESNEIISRINDYKKDFLYKANNTFYNIACERGRYYSCLGTNHSEHNEFLEAVQIIDFAIDAGIFNYGTTQVKNQHLIQRLNFYKAHAYMYCGEFEKAHNCFDSFEQYCKEYEDNDGFAHLAIYKAYLMMLERGLNNLTYNEIESALIKLRQYKPSLYSNIQMIDERKMLIHLLNSLLLVKILLGNEIEEDEYLMSILNPLAALPIELYKSIKAMETNSGRELFESGKLNYTYKEDGSQVYLLNYLGINILWIGDIPDNVTTHYEITERYFQKASSKHYLVINDSVDNIDFFKQNPDYLTSCKGVIVDRDYTVSLRNKYPELKFMNCEREDLLHYAYILAAYGLVCSAFLEQKPFLGMSPTKITQQYVYRPRVYTGLYFNDCETTNSEYFGNEINKSNSEFDKQTKIANSINNPEGIVEYVDLVDKLITDNSIIEKVSGLIFQPGLVGSASQRSTWIYKFYGSDIIVDNRQDKNKFYLRFRNITKTKIPYSNIVYSEFPDFNNRKERKQFVKCDDCDKRVTRIKGEYAFAKSSDKDWGKVLSFFENEILKNILYINYSCNDIKGLVCVHTDSGASVSSDGYLFMVLNAELTDQELNDLVSLVLKAFCRTYFKCDFPATDGETETEITEVEKKGGHVSEQAHQNTEALKKIIGKKDI